MNGPSPEQIRHYAAYCLGLKSYLQRPGDGRKHPFPSADARFAAFPKPLFAHRSR